MHIPLYVWIQLKNPNTKHQITNNIKIFKNQKREDKPTQVQKTETILIHINSRICRNKNGTKLKVLTLQNKYDIIIQEFGNSKTYVTASILTDWRATKEKMSARMLMLSVFIPIGIIALVVAIWGTAIITSATGLVVLVAMTFVREFGWTGVATATLLLWLLKWVLK